MTTSGKMTETLAVIDAPHFYAGIVLWNDEVTEAADIVKYMRRWSRNKVRNYCKGKGWRVFVVYRVEKPRQ
jgi:hypothetical protein